jgi:hypothetical protein
LCGNTLKVHFRAAIKEVLDCGEVSFGKPRIAGPWTYTSCSLFIYDEYTTGRGVFSFDERSAPCRASYRGHRMRTDKKEHTSYSCIPRGNFLCHLSCRDCEAPDGRPPRSRSAPLLVCVRMHHKTPPKPTPPVPRARLVRHWGQRAKASPNIWPLSRGSATKQHRSCRPFASILMRQRVSAGATPDTGVTAARQSKAHQQRCRTTPPPCLCEESCAKYMHLHQAMPAGAT